MAEADIVPSKVKALKGEAVNFDGIFLPIEKAGEGTNNPGIKDSEIWKNANKNANNLDKYFRFLALSDNTGDTSRPNTENDSDTVPIVFDRLCHVTNLETTLILLEEGREILGREFAESENGIKLYGSWWHPVVPDEAAQGLKEYHMSQIKKKCPNMKDEELKKIESAKVFTSSPAFNNETSRYGNYRY